MSYSTTFKEHLSHPQNVGELPHATTFAEETNPVCGDRLRLYLVITNDKIEAARYLAYGCAPTLVCGSVLTGLLLGKTITEALRITKAELLEVIGGLPTRKHHSAALAIEALHRALKANQA